MSIRIGWMVKKDLNFDNVVFRLPHTDYHSLIGSLIDRMNSKKSEQIQFHEIIDYSDNLPNDSLYISCFRNS